MCNKRNAALCGKTGIFGEKINIVVVTEKYMQVAIVGASGLVGAKLTEILAYKIPHAKLLLYGNTSVGKTVFVRGKGHKIQPISQILSDKPNYAMFMASEEVAREYIPQLSQYCVCVDNSAAFRLTRGVPLVIPQVNGQTIGCNKVISNPNCTTIQVVIALHALIALEPTVMTVATYQSVSGAGRDGLEDLQEKRSYGKLKCFAHPVYDNLIPAIGEILPDGTTMEEQKLRKESRKILNMPSLAVNSFCVRVPISVGHGAFVNIKFGKTFELDEVRTLLKREKDLLLFDNSASLPMPQVVRHTHFVGVGRLSSDGDGGLNMFVVADNLLRGAAYNAYQILETSMKNNGDLL